jgi:hypothetical protein
MNRVLLYFAFASFSLLVVGCGSNQKHSTESLPTAIVSDDSLLNRLQYETFQYFWEGAEPTSGMARERIHMDNIYPSSDQNVVTSGGSGFRNGR